MVFQRLKKVKMRNVVFQHRENAEGLLATVFQQQKGRGETIAGRSCFVDENDDEMADRSVLGVGKKMKSVELWSFSIGKMMKDCWQQCFRNRREEAKQLMDGVVSSMKMMMKWRTGVF
jgi:hypothetical protein